jgi:hypothetical protein
VGEEEEEKHDARVCNGKRSLYMKRRVLQWDDKNEGKCGW